MMLGWKFRVRTDTEEAEDEDELEALESELISEAETLRLPPAFESGGVGRKILSSSRHAISSGVKSPLSGS